MSTREVQVQALWKKRPRSRFLRVSVVLLLALVVGAWFLGDFPVRQFLERRAAGGRRVVAGPPPAEPCLMEALHFCSRVRSASACDYIREELTAQSDDRRIAVRLGTYTCRTKVVLR